MSVFYDLSKTPRNILNQAIVRAIVSENNGAWLDPSDLSTLYQDAAGTVPVTEVEQPVGKMLDKSGNGYHATQSITASRPTLSARYNLLTKTEDITSSAWSTMGVVTRTKNYSTSPDGTLTSQRIIFSDSSNVNQFFLQQITPASNYVEAVFIRTTSGSGKIKFGVYDGQIKVNTYDITEQWQLITYANLISGDTSRLCWLYPDGAGFATDVQIWHPSATRGTSAGPYQRVNTSSDYDTDERYFPKYLQFDGIDDYLNLPYMGLYAAGSASVVAGVNGHQYGKTFNGRILCESLVSANAPTYAPLIQLYTANTTAAFMTNDAATIFAITDLLLAQNSVIAISMIDSGASIKSYQNSLQKAAYTYTRSGTVTLNSTTIGKGINNGSAELWQGDLYGLIITKSALTNSQRVACERFEARKSGVLM